MTTSSTPLLAAVEARRVRRRQERREAESQLRAYAAKQAGQRREQWAAELQCVASAIRVLALLGLTPRDVQIAPDCATVYLDGRAALRADATLRVGIVLGDHPVDSSLYMDLQCACELWNWSRRIRYVSVHELHDAIVSAADELLHHVESKCAFEQV